MLINCTKYALRDSSYTKLCIIIKLASHLYLGACYITNDDTVAKAIEYMMLDGLLSADNHLHFAEHMKDPRKYLHLNDSLIRIELSKEPVNDIFKSLTSSVLPYI